MHIIHGITVMEIIFLVCFVVCILFPFAVFAIAMTMDAVYSYLDDKWVEKGERSRNDRQKNKDIP